MAQENNQKKEEKDFLAREEIKTMEKDVSGLRETEARHERTKVAEIKTEQELAREKEREQLAHQAALERNLAEKEAKEREEKIRKMREAAIKKSEASQNESELEKEEKVEGFQEVLKETQTKEEEARKKFLDKVAAMDEGKEEAPALSPLPPTPPAVKEVDVPKTAKPLLKKPSTGQKLWIRVVLSLLVLSILALIATFSYWYIVIRVEEPEITAPIEVVPEEKQLVIPPSLFYIENSQTITAPLFNQAIQEHIEQGLIKRIVIQDTSNNQVLGLKDFFNLFSITTPENFYDKVENDFTLFVYSQEEGNRLGLVVKINDPEGLADMMTSWEGTMEQDFESFFETLGKTEPALVSYFKDAKYQEESFRFQTFSLQDIGIVYATFDNYFILTTSWQSMEKALDKLKEISLSLENMSLAEKIGQLFFIGINGTTISPETEKLIANVKPGGVLLLKKNIVNKDQTKKLIQDLQQISLKNSGIPLFIGVDQEGGEISPVNFIQEKTAQSEIKTADQAYVVGFGRGEELKDLGINLNLAPVLDITRPGDFLFSRAFQALDSESVALAKALISGQKMASILTAIKHFPGYGDIAFDPEDKLATLEETPEVGLFITASEAKPEFVMTSNVIYSEIDPDLPFSFSQKGIEWVKQSVGSEPLIMTDDLPQQSLIDRFSLKGVVTLPILAGADILTFSNNWETTLPEAVRILNEAVRNGEITQEQINDSVLKIIKLKKAYYEQ
ncbi:MAG: glycoside hydrolase family 3 N-terminal domain-containing protein [Candidatus Nealsonbacteria bacterium]